MKRQLHTNGFTLTELLIALAIIAVVMVSLYAHFFGVMRLYHGLSSSDSQYQTWNMCFAKMETELNNSVLYPECPWVGTGKEIVFPACIARYTDGKQYTELCRVRYWYAEHQLMRGIQPLRKKTLEAPEEKKAAVLSGIAECSFSFAYSTPDKKIVWKDSWKQEHDEAVLNTGQYSRGIPVSVRLTVTMQARQKTDVPKKRLVKTADTDTVEKTFFVPVGTWGEEKLSA